MSINKLLSELGTYLVQHQLAWGNSGNLSAKVNEEQMLITASGSYMGSLSPADFVEVDVQTGNYTGERKPSKEIPMHTAIYKVRPEAKAIIHSSPFWSTLTACSELDIRSELFVESMYYLENIACVDYYHPGSMALGEAIEAAALQAQVIFLKNHGVIVFDENIDEARMRLETLEMACRMIVTAKSAGLPLLLLEPHIVEDFRENSGYKPRKQVRAK